MTSISSRFWSTCMVSLAVGVCAVACGSAGTDVEFDRLFLVTDTLPHGTLGEPYGFAMEATGGDGVYSWSLSSGSLPTGLELSLNGMITGTPTEAGLGGPLTIEVTSGDGQTFARPYALLVAAGAPAAYGRRAF